MSYRPAAVAGRFYPDNPKQLRADVEHYLQKITTRSGKIRGIIVPHAGYIYSGQVAAMAYGMLEQIYRRAILMGNSHYLSFKGISSFKGSGYETPLGKLDFFKHNLKTEYHPEAHREEHNLEVQLPFLQVTQPDIEILPLIFGSLDIIDTATKIERLINRDTLLIASSDLSHFHPYHKAQQVDQQTAKHINHFNLNKITPHDACGATAIKVLLTIAQRQGWQIKQLMMINSGDSSGYTSRVVGYGSWILEERS